MSYLDNLRSHFLEWTAGKWAELEALIREKDELIRLYELELSPERVKEIRIRVRLSVLALASQQLQQAQGSSSSSGLKGGRQGQGSSSAYKSTPGLRLGPADKKRKPKNKQKGLSSSMITGIAVGSLPVPANIYEGHDDGHGAGEAGGMDPANPKTGPLSPTSAAAILRQKLRDKFNSYRKAQAIPKPNPLKMVPLRFPSGVPEPRRKPKFLRSRLRDVRKKKDKWQWGSKYRDLEVVDLDEPQPVSLPTIPVTISPAPGSSRSLSGSATATPHKSKKDVVVDVDPPDSDEDEISVLEEIVKDGKAEFISSNQNGNGGGSGSVRNADATDGKARRRRPGPPSPPKEHGRAPLTWFQDSGSGVWLPYYNCNCGYRCLSENSLERHLRSWEPAR